MHFGSIKGQCGSMMADEELKKFENWKVSELRAFLLARDVPVGDQMKALLVRNCYLAVSLGLQVKKKTPEAYAQTIVDTKREKLILDAGLIRLPDPDSLTVGWENSPSSLPNISQGGTETYFDKSKYTTSVFWNIIYMISIV